MAKISVYQAFIAQLFWHALGNVHGYIYITLHEGYLYINNWNHIYEVENRILTLTLKKEIC